MSRLSHDHQNVLAEASEPAEENFPSEEIFTDVASLFEENPASVETVNHDKLIRSRLMATRHPKLGC